jgi:hypothetical protein
MGAPFFDYLDRHPEVGIPFYEQMTAYAMMDPAIVAAYDFSPFATVCDVGGGAGSFLKTMLAANPHLQGILFDMPGVVAHHLPGDGGDRVQVIGGSFFERVPSADLLILKTVLHDWSDEKCGLILARCRAALPANGRLLIVDRVIDEPVDAVSAFYDLHMLVMMDGRERTAAEFDALLAKAGLRLLRIIVPTGSMLFPLRVLEASR